MRARVESRVHIGTFVSNALGLRDVPESDSGSYTGYVAGGPGSSPPPSLREMAILLQQTANNTSRPAAEAGISGQVRAAELGDSRKGRVNCLEAVSVGPDLSMS